MSALNDLHYYLVNIHQHTNIIKGRLVDNPIDTVGIFQYAGRAPIYTIGGRNRERPGIQLQSRALKDENAELRIYVLANLLEQIVNQTINGTWYLRVEMLSAPYQLRHDQNDRSIWAANFAVEKEK